MRQALIVTVVLLASGVAGCASPIGDDEDGKRFEAAGSGRTSWFAPNWSLHGVEDDARRVFCVILIQTDAAKNTGQIRFDLERDEMHGKNWDFVMDQFSGDEPWKDGGIRRDFDAHGSTGVLESFFPQTHVQEAGWGEVRVHVDDRILVDPVTGASSWLASYEVLTAGVRDDAVATVQSPAKAGDTEIHFTMKAHAPPPQTTQTISASESNIASSPGGAPFNKTYTLVEDNKYFGAVADLNITISQPAVPPSLRVRVLDPQGVAMYTNTADQASETFPVRVTLEKLGKYTLEVAGTAASAQLNAVGTYFPPNEVMMNFWWEDVLYDAEAVFEYDYKRHDHGGTH